MISRMASRIRNVFRSDIASVVFPFFHKIASPMNPDRRRRASMGMMVIWACVCNWNKKLPQV